MMKRAYYADFSTHCLRFYVRHKNPVFRSEKEKENWTACDEIVKTYDDKIQDIIRSIFGGNERLSVLIEQTSRDYNIGVSDVWELTNELERKVAEKRGLL